MNNARGFALFALAVAALGAVAAFVAGGAPSAEGSALSHGARGWLLARLYLEARGTRVRLLDAPPAPKGRPGTLVLVFPWQAGTGDAPADVGRHLGRGGDVLFAYSGRALGFGEPGIAEGLGLELVELETRLSLVPWRWRREASREWRLLSPAGIQPALEGRVREPRVMPEAPEGAQVLLDGPTRPVAFSYRRSNGRVFVVPAEALANARLSDPGHLALLERLRADLPGPWAFDEYHHGLRPSGSEAGGPSDLPVDAFLVQIALVYAAVLATRARRLGPAWSDPPLRRSSARAFLVGLGALHHRLGHHAVAAAKLPARVRELDPRVALGDDELPAVRGADAAGLVETARRVSRAQRGRDR
jgi:hypothetical protein